MSRRWFVEAGADDHPQFVRVKRSRSYHHHNHRRHSDYYKVSPEDWQALVDQNRALEENNVAYIDQNNTLRQTLSASQAEVLELTAKVNALHHAHESSSYRHREMPKLRHRISELEQENKLIRDENEDLRLRLHELSKQVDQGANRRVCELKKDIEYWSNQRRFWKHKFEDLQENYERLRKSIDLKTEKVVIYEDILRRNYLLR